MENLDIEAIYENGTLKLSRELPFLDGQKVLITIHLASGGIKRCRGLINWKGTQEDLDYLILSDENDLLES